MTPSATPLLTREAIADLKRAGLSRLAVSLDGSVRNCMMLSAAFRVSARTLEAIRWANQVRLRSRRDQHLAAQYMTWRRWRSC